MAVKEITAKATMLIRRPVAEVFNAFIEPSMLTRFWLASASGSLELGKSVHWEFMVPGAEVDTRLVALERDRLLEIQWSDGTFVRWTFEPLGEGTRVAIEHWGFDGSQEDVIENALEATQGFTIVLCDLKTTLEHNQSMSLVRDKAVLIQRAMQDSG